MFRKMGKIMCKDVNQMGRTGGQADRVTFTEAFLLWKVPTCFIVCQITYGGNTHLYHLLVIAIIFKLIHWFDFVLRRNNTATSKR